MIRKLFRNAHIVTPINPGEPLSGPQQGKVASYEKGALYCRNGFIERIGEERSVLKSLAANDVDVEVDCMGRCLIPGFVDPHTHMCFANPREKEFAMRMEGVSYLEILRQGGGILETVRDVRAISEDRLYAATAARARTALRLGTTTLEIKSGYGLDAETELRMLRVIARVGRETPLDVIPTFMGAHAVPEEYLDRPDAYVDKVLAEMIPAVTRQGLARFCDVFCEKGVFSVSQSRRILQAARGAGLLVKLHADEVHDLGGAVLAAEMDATSAEHLLAAGHAGLKAMASKKVIGVLLPGTAYSLQKPYAAARKMVELGLPIALATDCNPGSSYTESMPFIFGLAVLTMKLSVNEALVGTTLNAAYALQVARQVGSLEVGKFADFQLLEGETPAILAYHAGVPAVAAVYKKGERVV
jgi:imidazolonepropionase